MSKIEKAVSWALNIAADNTHGYSQKNRWGPDYDCSSLVISAYKQAGVPLACTYTGNMRGDMLSHGFTDVTKTVDRASGAGLRRGDVLLHERDHTALYIGNGQVVHARSSEGNSVPGDGSGSEIRTQSYWNYPWDCVLRYAETEAALTLPEIAFGDESETVRAMQGLLILRGYSCGRYGADGEFGSMTKLALADFQLDNDLEPDAICGVRTWTRLICA